MPDSPITHEIILSQLEKNSEQTAENAASITRLRDDLNEIREENAPIREFFSDMGTVARVGRGVRNLIGGLVLFAFAIALIWSIASEAYKSYG